MNETKWDCYFTWIDHITIYNVKKKSESSDDWLLVESP